MGGRLGVGVGDAVLVALGVADWLGVGGRVALGEADCAAGAVAMEDVPTAATCSAVSATLKIRMSESAPKYSSPYCQLRSPLYATSSEVEGIVARGRGNGADFTTVLSKYIESRVPSYDTAM